MMENVYMLCSLYAVDSSITVLWLVFQMNLGWPVVFGFFRHWKRVFGWVDVLPVIQPKCQSTEWNPNHWPVPIVWTYPVFICHRTLKDRALQCLLRLTDAYTSMSGICLIRVYLVNSPGKRLSRWRQWWWRRWWTLNGLLLNCSSSLFVCVCVHSYQDGWLRCSCLHCVVFAG